ncbi:glycosyltransferase [Pyramidobacter sp. CG50-2]|nr:glycosyltransferase [Pyramidobacter sp. CG50-2]
MPMPSLKSILRRIYRRIFTTPNRKILWQLLDKLTEVSTVSAEQRDAIAALRDSSLRQEKGIQTIHTRLANQRVFLEQNRRDEVFVWNKRFSDRETLYKISVIVPAYNVEQYLAECLNSILDQNMESMEVLCVNDGSTDGSYDILKMYAQKDRRIKIFDRSHQGLGTTRNYALRQAQGEYICFVDSDDMLAAPEALNYLYREAKAHDLDILYFDGDALYENNELAQRFPQFKTDYRLTRPREYGGVADGQELFCAMQADHCYRGITWLQLIRRTFLTEHRILFPENVTYEDEFFTLSCMLQAQRVSHRQKNFYRYRLRRNSIVTSPQTNFNVYSSLRCFISTADLVLALPLRQQTAYYVAERLNELYGSMLHRYNNLHGEICGDFSNFEPVTSILLQKLISQNK